MTRLARIAVIYFPYQPGSSRNIRSSSASAYRRVLNQR